MLAFLRRKRPHFDGLRREFKPSRLKARGRPIRPAIGSGKRTSFCGHSGKTGDGCNAIDLCGPIALALRLQG
jgi:hypothetical protein